MSWTDFHQIFRIVTHTDMGGDNQPELVVLRSLKGRFHGNLFLERIGENWRTPPLFCALAFNNGSVIAT